MFDITGSVGKQLMVKDKKYQVIGTGFLMT
jgi:hypothetical protein